MYKTIAITSRQLVHGDFLTQIRKICEQKVDIILLREPDLSPEIYVGLAKKVKAICDDHQVELRWHFFVEAAKEAGEKTIHLPLNILEEKDVESFFEVISTSVHSVEEARRGKVAGATELLVSNIYRTNCKPGLEGKGLLLIEQIKLETGLPVYALGGISWDRISSCINAGADGICMMSEFMKQNELRKRENKMNQYSTQMEAARKGIITKQMNIVAEKERFAPEEIRELVAQGKVVICANKHHEALNPEGVGSMLQTKINVNLGVSRDCKDYDVEMEKVLAAVEQGAHAIMDLSSHGDTRPFRRKLIGECPAMIGTVPIYDSVIHYQRDLDTLTAKDFVDVIRLHAQDGVDFVTLHCGITRKTIDQIRKHKRKMNIVSRGGSLIFAWMCMTGNENPFYEYYDEILEVCREHDVTISLGDACRPGCLADASDVCQIEELVRLGELTKRAWERDVQIIVEGPGHVPMDQIAANMKIQQTICQGAPFYVLGPIVTDIAPGYDHITAAIGGAIAAANGAAFLCYVTPAEHLALPNLEDVKQGIIATKIAAHAADIAKGVRGAREIDDRMADARRELDWEGQWKCAMDPETAKRVRQDRKPEHDDTCSMCGKFCAVRSMNKALANEHIDIL